MLRAREAKMLSREALERMLAAEGLEEAARIAVDHGYPEINAESVDDIDRILSEYRASVYEELRSMTPEPELLDVFRIKYDYHNAKAMLKGIALGAEYQKLLSDAGRIDIDELKHACDTGDYSYLPGRLGEAMQEASAVLARTANPQLAEFILDRAYFKDVSELSGELSGGFLSDYAKLMADRANLETVVRTVRMGKPAEFLATALAEGGYLSVSEITAAVQGGSDIASLFKLSPLEEAAALGAEAMEGGPLTAFELACDNALGAYLDKVKLVPFGADVVAAYLALLDTEITDVRMILSGKLCKVPAASVKERLRDLNV